MDGGLGAPDDSPNTPKTFRKLALRSLRPSTGPVAHGGWRKCLRIVALKRMLESCQLFITYIMTPFQLQV